MKHAVRTYNLSGKFIHEAHFETAEKAYEDYRDTIENLKKNYQGDIKISKSC